MHAAARHFAGDRYVIMRTGNARSTAGLSTQQARTRLLQAIARFHDFQEKRGETLGWQPFSPRRPDQWILACISLPLLVVSLACSSHRESTGLLLVSVLLMLNGALNLWISYRSRVRDRSEVALRVAAVAKELQELSSRGTARAVTPRAAVSSILAYRDQVWMHVPESAVVRGDVIALRDGDAPPGRAKLILDPRDFRFVQHKVRESSTATAAEVASKAGFQPDIDDFEESDEEEDGFEVDDEDAESEGVVDDDEEGVVNDDEDDDDDEDEAEDEEIDEDDIENKNDDNDDDDDEGKGEGEEAGDEEKQAENKENEADEKEEDREDQEKAERNHDDKNHDGISNERSGFHSGGYESKYDAISGEGTRAGLRPGDSDGNRDAKQIWSTEQQTKDQRKVQAPVKEKPVIVDAFGKATNDSAGSNPGCMRGSAHLLPQDCDARQASAPQLLQLCGELKCYVMKETPAVHQLQAAVVAKAVKRKPFLLVHLDNLGHQIRPLVTAAFILVLVVGIIRAPLVPHDSWVDCVVVNPLKLLLCFSPLALPLLRVLVEAMGTAQLMAVSGVLEEQVEAKAIDHESELDADERHNLLSRSSTGTEISLKRFLSCFIDVMRFRLCDSRVDWRTGGASTTTFVPASGGGFRRLVQLQPLHASHALFQLGAVTRVCIVDSSMLCEPQLTADEIFLLKGDSTEAPLYDGARGTTGSKIIDLHPDSSSASGLRFEDPHWRDHLASLKPIGLTCMLRASGSRPNWADWASPSSTGSLPPLGPDSLCEATGVACASRSAHMLASLMSYVQTASAPHDCQHLRGLASEIGFDVHDLATFRPRRCIRTFVPDAVEDRREHDEEKDGAGLEPAVGILSPQLTSFVIEDRRSHGLQLLSRAEPSAAIASCSECWDGRSIGPLTPEHRKLIADIAARWRAENMHCDALAYAPVPERHRAQLCDIAGSSAEFGTQEPYLVLNGNTMKGDGDGVEDETKRHVVPSQHPLWQLQSDQIFLGMVASCINPKQETVRFIEDVAAAGIRFVYFSPTSMRRSKTLAERMGIETDWNCAISLRSLESGTLDPHRMKSSYADWDVKARLPHGIPAIRAHLDQVDDVPLLVSLFSDSTPEAVCDMFDIFAEHEEVCLCIGSTLKSANAALFAKADCQVGLEDFARSHDVSQDLGFASLLNSLPCSVTAHGQHGLPIVFGLLFEGRRLLRNLWQCAIFIVISHTLIACVCLGGRAVPFNLSPSIEATSLIWLLWVVVPMCCLPLLSTNGAADLMQVTPQKNDAPACGIHGNLKFLAILCMLPAILCLIIFEWVAGLLLCQNEPWYGCVCQSHKPSDRLDFAINTASNVMTFALVVMLVTFALCSQHRARSLISELPWRNHAAMLCSIVVLVSQFLFSFCEERNSTTTCFPSSEISSYVWIAVGLSPLLVVILSEATKRADSKLLDNEYSNRRFMFDTRLGCYSPR